MEPGSRPRPQYGEYADPEGSAPTTTNETAEDVTDSASDVQHGQDPAAAWAAAPSSQPEELVHRPQYGEADSSGSLTDSGVADPADNEFSTPAQPNTHADSNQHAITTRAQEPRTPGALPGVPHNLGVRRTDAQPATGAAPSPRSTAGQTGHGEPYRADDNAPTHKFQAPPAATMQAPATRSTPTDGTHTAHDHTHTSQTGPRKVDRIVTIILLIIGGYAALRTALNLMVMGASLSDIATNALNIENFVLPQSVNTLGTVGAITTLTLYALVLIFSIQRLRAHKLTFWAPLTAGVISFILMIAFFAIALSQAPEILQAGLEPEAMQQMLEYAQTMDR